LQEESLQSLAAIKLQMQPQQQQLCRQKQQQQLSQQQQLKTHYFYRLDPLHLLGPGSVFLPYICSDIFSGIWIMLLQSSLPLFSFSLTLGDYVSM
jgi:hypothetical protein